MRRLFRVMFGLVLCLIGLQVSTFAQGQPELLFPDLKVLKDRVNLQVRRQNHRKVIRLSTCIANAGEGAMEVVGYRENTRQPMLAYQIVYDAAGNAYQSDQSIGTFQYHRAHGHWHLLQVATYRVLMPNGRQRLQSSKVSFCLEDTGVFSRGLPGFNDDPVYLHCELSPYALELRAGVSVGWFDEYGASLPGQSIDVSNLRGGNYVLEIRVNPNSIIDELSTSNNTIQVPFRL